MFSTRLQACPFLPFVPRSHDEITTPSRLLTPSRGTRQFLLAPRLCDRLEPRTSSTNQETKKPRNQGTKKPRNQGTKKARNQESKEPRNQGTKKPRNQERRKISNRSSDYTGHRRRETRRWPLNLEREGGRLKIRAAIDENSRSLF